MLLQPQDLDKTKLPLIREVVQYVIYLRSLIGNPFSYRSVEQQAAVAIEELWNTTQIPIIAHRSLISEIERLIHKYQHLLRRKASQIPDN